MRRALMATAGPETKMSAAAPANTSHPPPQSVTRSRPLVASILRSKPGHEVESDQVTADEDQDRKADWADNLGGRAQDHDDGRGGSQCDREPRDEDLLPR